MGINVHSKRKLRKIATRYGVINQRRKLVEESAEFTQAWVKYTDHPTDEMRKNMIEEFSDMCVVSEQIKMLLSPRELHIFRENFNKKLDREIERIETGASLTPTRREILKVCRDGNMSVRDIASVIHKADTSIRKDMRTLIPQGFIKTDMDRRVISRRNFSREEDIIVYETTKKGMEFI
jgi:hypothetical protein